MTNRQDDMNRAFASAESVGTIGSPSSTTEIKMNIRGAAAENKLVGEVAIFRYRQQNAAQYALGQITEVNLHNRMLEDHAMLTLARRRGHVDHVSEDQDTHDGEMQISAVYRQNSNGFQESSMGTVPPTGTDIKLASNDLVNEIIKDHANNVFYLGTSYQSQLDLPLWFRQFNGAPGQLAEAHHIGIFGRSGSGKSTLAKLILLAYATHPEMGILIIDPQGEFAKSITGQPENFDIGMRDRLLELNRQIINIDVNNIVLGRWELVEELLAESALLTELGITTPGPMNPKESAASSIVAALRSANIVLSNLHQRQSFDTALDAIRTSVQQRRLYSGPGPNERITERINSSNLNDLYRDFWQPLLNLFNSNRAGALSTDNVIRQLLSLGQTGRPIVNISLVGTNQTASGVQWNDRIRNITINQILSELERAAESAYQGSQSLNTLVVIEEAHRLAPNFTPDDNYSARIRARLADSARTTRKYGLGWMFISQTLASVFTDIVRQTRIQFFGQGLAMGSELQSLRELVGGDSNNIRLYQSFKDPESAFSAASREYSFMAAGPVSPLCLTATPIFLSVYNSPNTFFEKNRRSFPRANQ